MNTGPIRLAVLIVLTTGCGCAAAADGATESDALRLMQLAQDYLKSNGLDKAIVEFNRLDSPFNSQSPINPYGDMYLYSLAPDGFQIIHGKNPKIRGKVMIDMRDADGVYLIREMVKVCFESKDGKGWVRYKWPHPVTKTVEPKLGYVERVPGVHNLCLGTGIYRQ